MDAEPSISQPLVGGTWQALYDDFTSSFLSAKSLKAQGAYYAPLDLLSLYVEDLPLNVAIPYTDFITQNTIPGRCLDPDIFQFGQMYQNLII